MNVPGRTTARKPNLARALLCYAAVRITVQIELPQALLAAEEAVGIYQALAQSKPETFLGYMKVALTTLADALDAHGRHERADQVRRWEESLPETPLL